MSVASQRPSTGPAALPPSGSAGGVLTGSYPAPGLADGVVTTSKIADGTISAVDLSDLAVTASKLADGAVIASKIPDGSIAASKLAAGVLSGAVTHSHQSGTTAIPSNANTSVASYTTPSAGVWSFTFYSLFYLLGGTFDPGPHQTGIYLSSTALGTITAQYSTVMNNNVAGHNSLAVVLSLASAVKVSAFAYSSAPGGSRTTEWRLTATRLGAAA